MKDATCEPGRAMREEARGRARFSKLRKMPGAAGFSRRFAFALALAGSLAACTTTIESGPQSVMDDSKVASLRKGVTTKAEVRNNFGAPLMQNAQGNGDESWMYSFSSRYIDPNASFVARAFGGGQAGTGRTIMITFGPGGTLKDYNVISSSSGSSPTYGFRPY